MTEKSNRQHQVRSDDRDRALVAGIAAQDRDAFSELYANYQPRLFKFVFRLIQTYDVAEELVNDVMLCVWRGADKYRGAAKVSTWIFGIAYRQTMRRVSKKSLSLVDDFDPDQISGADGPNIEQEDWVRAAIDSLPSLQRAAVILVFYAGLTYAEAATIAECPVNTIKTRMFHARRRLKYVLEKKGQPKTIANEKLHA